MILKLDEKTVFIAHFHHYRVGGDHKLWDGGTICTIHEGPCASKERPCGTMTAVSGIARCSRKDSFVKAKGRKLSFTRAIAHMDRGTRARLWAAYFAKEGMPVAA
jgi:hypothetical protein